MCPVQSVHTSRRTAQTDQISAQARSNKSTVKNECPHATDSFTGKNQFSSDMKDLLQQINQVEPYSSTMSETLAQRIEKKKSAHRKPLSREEAIGKEQAFANNPTVDGFFELVKEFHGCMKIVGHEKFRLIEDIAISDEGKGDDLPMAYSHRRTKKHEKRINKDIKNFNSKQEKAIRTSKKREEKITRLGPGRGGKASKKISELKSRSFYVKNNATIRGNMFKMTHTIHPKNIYEIMPRYGHRKGGHVAVRISQFSINGILMSLGYGLTPVTFGISKIATDHLRTVITLSGEAIAHKIAGAEMKKISTHATLRGVQLELPRSIPFAGDLLMIGEKCAMGSSAFGIVSTSLADMIMGKFSTRYRAVLNRDDLGDSRCIGEFNNRIDYLSRFLLPYGQYLFFNEKDEKKRSQLRSVLKENFRTLRRLERKKINSLTYYRLAIAANKVPNDMREAIIKDCEAALPDTRINTHRIVSKYASSLQRRLS
jgi:hypothetical protein